jgi:hypothetical protein
MTLRIDLKGILQAVENALSKYGKGRCVFEYIGATKDGKEVVERYNIHASFDSFRMSLPVLTLKYEKKFLGRKKLVDFVVYPPDEIVKDIEMVIKEAKAEMMGETGGLFVDMKLLKDLRELKELLDWFFSKLDESGDKESEEGGR